MDFPTDRLAGRRHEASDPGRPVTPWRRLRQARHLRPLKDLGAGNLDPLAGGPRGHGVTRRAMNGTSPPDFAAALSL
jgi:hypothetical protein